MMRASTIMTSSALTTRNLLAQDYLLSSGSLIQCVRWKRKPMWLPTAKTKVFRVSKRPVIPKEDYLELQRLYNNYRTYMKSLREYIKVTEAAKLEDFEADAMNKKEAEEFLQCTAINDEWNRKVAKEREDRLLNEREVRKEEIQMILLQEQERMAALQEEIEATVRKAKEDSATFITPENVDTAIEIALESIVNHDAAIDSNGNFYKGQYPESAESDEQFENRVEAAQ